MASDKEDELVVQLTVQLLISQVAYREAAQPKRKTNTRFTISSFGHPEQTLHWNDVVYFIFFHPLP